MSRARCVSTVRGLMPNEAPISLLVLPSASCRSTSPSREVSVARASWASVVARSGSATRFFRVPGRSLPIAGLSMSVLIASTELCGISVWTVRKVVQLPSRIKAPL